MPHVVRRDARIKVQADVDLQKKGKMMSRLKNHIRGVYGLVAVPEGNLGEEDDSWDLQSVLGNSGGNSKKKDTRLVFATIKSIQNKKNLNTILENLLALYHPPRAGSVKCRDPESMIISPRLTPAVHADAINYIHAISVISEKESEEDNLLLHEEMKEERKEI